MLLQPWMVRRALHGKIQRHFHVVLLAGGNKTAEVLKRAQLGMDGVVSAFGGADRVGAAGIAFLCGHRIVAALAVFPADRMDRREVDDVKAHGRDIGQPLDAVPERSVLTRHLALAARDHLVPRTVACPRPVHDKWKQLRARQVGPRLTLGHRMLQFVRKQRLGFPGLEIDHRNAAG